jgi:hypothetical protein
MGLLLLSSVVVEVAIGYAVARWYWGPEEGE